jgi:hypothetical protein
MLSAGRSREDDAMALRPLRSERLRTCRIALGLADRIEGTQVLVDIAAGRVGLLGFGLSFAVLHYSREKRDRLLSALCIAINASAATVPVLAILGS